MLNNLGLLVYGYDQFSGAKNLVDALLEDPFLTNYEKEAIHQRWQDRAGPLILQ